MKTYAVKVWIEVQAESEDDAEREADFALDRIWDVARLGSTVLHYAIEGEGSTYELDSEEDA